MKKIFNFLCLLYLIIQTTHAQPVIVGSENFDGPPHQFTISSSGGAIVDNNYSLSNPKSLWMLVPIVSGDSIIVTTPVYDCEAYEFVALQFSHICKVSPSDLVRIQYRPDYVGETWKDIPSSAYRGKASNYASSGFNAQSYTIWNNADSTAIPSNSWWKNEVFNLSNQASFAKVQFRFIIKKRDVVGSNISYGWLIDDFKVLGSSFKIDAPVCKFINNFIDTVYHTGPYTINAKIATRTAYPILQPYLVYTASHPAEGTVKDSIAMTAYEGDSLWTATIPQYILGTTIKYSIHAEDSVGNFADIQNGFFTKHFSVGSNGDSYIGDTSSTATTQYVPYYYIYDYSWTKTLYLSSEITPQSQGGLITNIAYQVGTNTNNYNERISIYFKAVQENTIVNKTYMDPIQEGFTLVWSGTGEPNVGWYDLELSNKFVLPPSHNLLIYVINNDGSYSNNGLVAWRTSPIPENTSELCYYKYADGGFPTGTGEELTSRPNIRLSMIGATADSNSVALTELFLNDTIVSYSSLQEPISVKIQNRGYKELTSATINWTLNGVLQTPYTWTGNMPDDYTRIDTIGYYQPSINKYDTIVTWISMPNGVVDTTTYDDTLSKIVFGSSDIILAWLSIPNDTVYTTGPHQIKMRAYSLSGQDMPDFNLVYSYMDTNGTVIETNSIAMTRSNNTWSCRIPNIPYFHNVEFGLTTTDIYNNIINFNGDYFINRVSGNGNLAYVYVEDTTVINYSVEEVPYADLYDYSWARILYLHTELGEINKDITINNIAYKVQERYGAGATNNVSCYMKVVDDTALSSTAYVDPLTDSATLVWSGNPDAIQGAWLEMTLNSPFFVPQDKNLLVYFTCNDGQYNDELYWYSATSVKNRCVSAADDGSMPTNGYQNYRPITRMHILSTGEDIPNAVALESLVSPKGSALAAGTHSLDVVIRNNGADILESCDITWSLNGVEQPIVKWTGNLLPDFIDTVNLGSFITVNQFYALKVWVSNPNGTIDTTSFFNDTLTADYVTCNPNLPDSYTLGGSGADFEDFSEFMKFVSSCGLDGKTTLEIIGGEYNLNSTIDLSIIGEKIDKNDTLIITSESRNSEDVSFIFEKGHHGFTLGKNVNIFIQNITIDVTNSSDKAGVYFKDTCWNIEVNNCIILAHPTTQTNTSAGIYYKGTSSSSKKMGDLRFLNNEISGGCYGIYLYYLHPNNTSLVNDPGVVTISGNNISDFYSHGLYAYYYGRYDYISNNTIQTRENINTSQYGMYVYYYNRVDSGIINNRILLRGINTGYGIYPYYLNHVNTGITKNALIANNIITKKQFTSGTFYGINVYYSNIDVFHNTIVGQGTGTNYCLYVSTMSNTYSANIKNNLIVAKTTSTKYPLYASNVNYVKPAYGTTLDFNNYYSTTNVGYVGGAINNLMSLQIATEQDVNSKNIAPQWVDTLAYTFELYNHEDFLAPNIGINTDINGNPRYNLTTMGANTIIPEDIVDLEIDSLRLNDSIVNVTLTNFGEGDITSATIYWSVNEVIQAPINWQGNFTKYSDQMVLTLGNLNKGAYDIKAWINDVNGAGIDGNQINDTVSLEVFVCDNPLAGTYTIGEETSDYLSVNDAIFEMSQCGISAPVTLLVASGTYSSLYIDQEIPGASQNNFITITSATGNAADVQFVAVSTEATSMDTAAIVLRGTAHWKFENVTFDATNGRCGVSFIDNNSDITFYGCDIKASPTTTSGNTTTNGVYKMAYRAVSYVQSSGSQTTLKDINFVKNNISGGYYGFYMYYLTGNGSKVSTSSVRIDSNNISDFYYYGIYLNYYGYYPSISYNIINGRNGASTQYGVYILYPTIDTIRNNKIILNNTSSTYGLYLYYNNYYDNQGVTGKKTPTIVVNNEIRNNASLSTSGNKYGLYLIYSNSDIFFNSIFLYGTSTCYGVYFNSMSTSHQTKIHRNLIYTNTSGNNYPIYAANTTYVTQASGTYLDYNNYSSINGNVGQAGTLATTIAAWRNISGQDANSVSILPDFVDTTQNLDIINYESFLVPNVGIDFDVRDRRRASTTNMGAYSMEVINAKSIELVEVLGLPDSNDRCTADPSTISYVLAGKGAIPIDFAQDSLFLHLGISGSMNWDTVVLYNNQGILDMGERLTIPVMNNFELVDSGYYYISAWISNSYDPISVDDSLFTSYTIHKITLPFDEDFSQGWSSSFTLEECNSEDTWEIVNTNSDGTILPQYGTNMLSFRGSRGATSAIYTRIMDLSKTSEPKLDFWYWHDNTASTMDYTNVLVSLDGGASFQTIATIRKNDGSNSGWTYYSLPLDKFNGSCVIVSFSAMRWSIGDNNDEQLIDRIRIYGKHDLAISEIISSDYDICNLIDHSLSVVLNATTSLNIDFSSMPTELQVNISGAKNASYTLPLNNGIIEGLAFDTLVIDNNFDFIPGTYYISASIATAIDSNQANDFILDTIEINPNISVAPTQITGGTSFANCVAIGSEVFQEVNISNSGNMDMTDILLTLNIYDVSGVIVQTYNDTINGDFPVGQELTYTFTKAYIVPEDETYNVEVIVSPLCDNNFKYVNYVTECVDLTDIELVSFVAPEDNADCSNVGDKQNVTVKISNKNPNVDMSGITIHAIISSNGNQINAWKATIDEISAGTSIDFTFAQSFTIPEENDYTIDVYIDKVDDANNNDTLSITKCINLGISETDINTIGMSQNIPNPANEMAIVNYTIPSQGKVVFTIASITGQILHTQEVESEAGVNSIEFNTANLAAGIYFYTMDFNGQRLTKKMTIKK